MAGADLADDHADGHVGVAYAGPAAHDASLMAYPIEFCHKHSTLQAGTIARDGGEVFGVAFMTGTWPHGGIDASDNHFCRSDCPLDERMCSGEAGSLGKRVAGKCGR